MAIAVIDVFKPVILHNIRYITFAKIGYLIVYYFKTARLIV